MSRQMGREPQMPLAIGLDVEARFETYYAGQNGAALNALRAPRAPGLWLAGAPRSGRSHLLQAVAAARPAGEVVYLPLGTGLPPRAVDGLPAKKLICLDDVDAVAGDAAWERALLLLYESVLAAGGSIIASAGDQPQRIGLELDDLVSRFGALSFFRLQPPDDEGQLRALKMRATARGLTLPDETARFLVQRLPRELPVLFDWLRLFDQRSLAARRKLTVPFVRDVINSGQTPDDAA